MPGLEETIAGLVSSFADDVIAALRRAPLDEVMALAGNETAGATVEAPPRTRRKRASSRRTDANEAVTGADISSLVDAAARVFAQRGSRGATAVQLQEALAAEGLSPAAAAGDVIRVLVERDIVRDAGFRRTTGHGTAPVFVSSR